MHAAHSNLPSGPAIISSAVAPSRANSTLTQEIWFGVIDVRTSAPVTDFAHALSRAAMGRRSVPIMLASCSSLIAPVARIESAVYQAVAPWAQAE